jgi:hypothetical protein
MLSARTAQYRSVEETAFVDRVGIARGGGGPNSARHGSEGSWHRRDAERA